MLTPCYPDPADLSRDADAGVAKAMFSAYSAAVTYIESSNAGKTLVKALRQSPLKINVAICTRGSEGNVAWSSSPFNSMFAFDEDGTATVLWNPGVMLQVKSFGGTGKAGKQSPAIGLAHELGHAKQWLDDPVGYMSDHNAAIMGIESGRAAARARIENDNVTRHEIPIAQELREPWRPAYEYFQGTSPLIGKNASKPWPAKVISHT